MTSRVRRLVLATVAAAIVTIAAAIFVFPTRPELGGWPGFVFWCALTLVGSSMPVRLPRGTVVSVSSAPMIAAMVLGGPAAAAVIAAIGSTDSRELRGEVPWYGTLYNHLSIACSLAVGGVVFELIRTASLSLGGTAAGLVEFIAVLVGSGLFFIINWTLAVAAVSARTNTPIRTIWAHDLSGVALSLIGLAPLGWLMAQIFQLPNGVGWWAAPLFVIPLLTTRLAYSRYVETRELFEQTIAALANAVDARDRYTRGHSGRVSHISEAMARTMGLAEREIEKIKWAGLLHDIGKIGIRDAILLKAGPLNREERILMNQHPSIGAEIVAPARQLADEAPLIRAHHEWMNGSGYPDGLEALEIPLGARILTVADAYEAMTSSRPYRKNPLTHEQAVAELEKYSGIQFDAEIVPVLVNLDRDILDWRADQPAGVPTMLHQPDPAAGTVAAAVRAPEAPGPRPQVAKKSRPALATDD